MTPPPGSRRTGTDGRRQLRVLAAAAVALLVAQALVAPALASVQSAPASSQPVLASGQSVLASGQPASVSVQSAPASSQSAHASSQSVLASGQSVLASGQPVLASGQPVLASGRPVLATTQPDIVDVELTRGDEFSDTTDPYWSQGLKVYRRGDTFTVTIETDRSPTYFGMEIRGPADYGWQFDRIECRRTGTGVDCNNGLESAQGQIKFVKFVGGSPQFEVTLKRPETTDVRVGRYAIQDAFVGECPAPTCELSRETVKPFYAVFNPFEDSGDDHVTGLAEGKLTAGSDGYVLGSSSRQFHWNGNANLPYQVEPTDEAVFEYAIDEVDSLGADATSAEEAATELVKTVNDDITGDWTPPYGGGSGTSFLRGTDVPATIDTIEAPGQAVCGQCMTFAAVTVASSRSVGIPSRMVTGWDVGTGDGDKSNAPNVADRTTWNFHMWTEGWLNEVSGGDWAAYDATPPTSSGQPPATLPTDESGKPALNPDALADATPSPPIDASKILASKWDGTAEDVTSNYADPPGPSGSDVVSVTPREPAVEFGEDIALDVTVDNPGTTPLTTTVTVTLAPEYVDTIYRRQVTTIATRTVTATVPPNGSTTRTVTVPASTYLVNGRFTARAATTVDGSAEVATATVAVDRRLALRVAEPPDLAAGEETTVAVTVRNLRDEPVSDVDVRLHAPPDADANSTRLAVGSLGALESATLTVTLTPDALPLAVEAQATSPDAGLAYRNVVLGGDGPAGPDVSVDEPSGTLGSGESVETTVTFEGVQGEAVSVSASVPEGVAVSFEPANGTVGPDGQFATTATLAADAGLQPGDYVVHVTARGGTSGAAVGTVELAVTAAPVFEIDYEVRETTVAPGESTTVAATVENAGTAAGEATLVLRVDGADRETRTVELAPGEHPVRVNDLAATTVTVEEAPGTTATGADGGGPGIPGFGVAAGLAALLVVALLARRRGGGNRR